jgi:hypothetical protein
VFERTESFAEEFPLQISITNRFRDTARLSQFFVSLKQEDFAIHSTSSITFHFDSWSVYIATLAGVYHSSFSNIHS